MTWTCRNHKIKINPSIEQFKSQKRNPYIICCNGICWERIYIHVLWIHTGIHVKRISGYFLSIHKLEVGWSWSTVHLNQLFWREPSVVRNRLEKALLQSRHLLSFEVCRHNIHCMLLGITIVSRNGFHIPNAQYLGQCHYWLSRGTWDVLWQEKYVLTFCLLCLTIWHKCRL